MAPVSPTTSTSPTTPTLPEAHQAPSPTPAPRALWVPPPRREVWQQLSFTLRFRSKEEAACYTIVASVPGLDVKDVKLQLSNDRRMLSVQGLRVPSAEEAAEMQEKISTRTRATSEEAMQLYLKLGQGRYGRFSETFRIPSNVRVDRIDASYANGVLRIVLPKMAPEMARTVAFRAVPTATPAALAAIRATVATA
nr:small heat shock protein sHsp21.2 [Dinophyceae sp.]